MVLLARVLFAVQVQELRPVQADAARAAREARFHIVGELDVAPQEHFVTVLGYSGQVPQVAE